MKRKSLLVFVAFVMFQMYCYTQITYEGTHQLDLKSFQLDNGTHIYARYDKSVKTVTVYHEDLSEWKSIELFVPGKQSLDELKSITVNVFNDDALLEMAYTCAEYRYSNDTETTTEIAQVRHTLFIINEKGELVLEAENGNNMKIVDSNGGRKLMVYKQIGDGSYKKEHIDVYALPKQNSSSTLPQKGGVNSYYSSGHTRGI